MKKPPYGLLERKFFAGECIDFYRLILYSLPDQQAMLSWTYQYAVLLKANAPAIHKDRTVGAIFIHLVYMDNFLVGIQLKFSKKDATLLGRKLRKVYSGLNPITSNVPYL